MKALSKEWAESKLPNEDGQEIGAGCPASDCFLLPCPFCGGHAEEFGFPGEMWVRCKSCRVMMPDDGPLDNHKAAWSARAGNAEPIRSDGSATSPEGKPS